MIDSREKELSKIILELSLEQNTLEDETKRNEIFKRLEAIYYTGTTDNFRHKYSSIFYSLTMIGGEIDKNTNLDILAQNIKIVNDKYDERVKNGECEHDVGREIFKLYDHINLEIARLNYTEKVKKEMQSMVETEKARNELLRIELDKVQRDFNTTVESQSKAINEKQEKMQTEYVAILGIFSTVVLAFVGDMAFSTSVLNNIHNVSIYRLVTIACIIGIVFIDLVWVLLNFIRRMVKKNCDDKGWKTPLIISNVILLFIMFLASLVYFWK